MSQSLNLTPSTAELGLLPVWRAAQFKISGTLVTGVTKYRAQIRRRPQAALTATPTALATCYGAILSTTVEMTFTGAQMDFELTAAEGAQDDLWLSISGLQGAEVVPLRAGWFRVLESGCIDDDFATAAPTWVFGVDTVLITQAGIVYKLLTMEVAAPSGAVDGAYLVLDDRIIFSSGGVHYAAPCAKCDLPPGLSAGGLLISNDVLYSLFDGQAYCAPVARV